MACVSERKPGPQYHLPLFMGMTKMGSLRLFTKPSIETLNQSSAGLFYQRLLHQITQIPHDQRQLQGPDVHLQPDKKRARRRIKNSTVWKPPKAIQGCQTS